MCAQWPDTRSDWPASQVTLFASVSRRLRGEFEWVELRHLLLLYYRVRRQSLAPW